MSHQSPNKKFLFGFIITLVFEDFYAQQFERKDHKMTFWGCPKNNALN